MSDIISKLRRFFTNPRNWVFISVMIVGIIVNILAVTVLKFETQGGFFTKNQQPLFTMVMSGISDVLLYVDTAVQLSKGEMVLCLILLMGSVAVTKITTELFSEKYCPKNFFIRLLFELSCENILLVLFTTLGRMMIPFINKTVIFMGNFGVVFAIIIALLTVIPFLMGAYYTLSMTILLTLTYWVLNLITGTVGKFIVVAIALAVNIVAEHFVVKPINRVAPFAFPFLRSST